jgi:hypothetical protein
MTIHSIICDQTKLFPAEKKFGRKCVKRAIGYGLTTGLPDGWFSNQKSQFG